MAFGKKDKTTSTAGTVTVPTDGLIHATVFQMSMTKIGEAWGSGNNLDRHLVDMQEQGAEILSVVPYVSNDDKLVKVLITFRAPHVVDLRPGH